MAFERGRFMRLAEIVSYALAAAATEFFRPRPGCARESSEARSHAAGSQT